MTGAGYRIFERGVPMHQVDGAIEIVPALFEGFQRAPPEATLLVSSAQVGEDYRQGDLAFPEIVPDRLTELGLVGGIVEGVVNELIDDAEVAPIFLERFLLDPGALRNHRSDPAGGGEERGGLRADHFQIGP